MAQGYEFLARRPDHKDILEEVCLFLGDAPQWFTTREVVGATNHCGAVMAANMRLCLLEPPSAQRSSILQAAYSAIGNGPVVRGIQRTRMFLASQGIDAHVVHAMCLRSITWYLSMRRPCALLVLGSSLSAWHWVVAYGYVVMRDGTRFLQIADGWNSRPRYFRNRAGSRIVSGAAFFTGT